jgi:aminoglycoside phosphotransferase (APT) family kinase protein
MDVQTAQKIVASTPLLSEVQKVEHLPLGYSYDEKYVLWQGGQRKYLLRLSDVRLAERRELEFRLLRTHRERGVPCSKPFEFGARDAEGVCYTVLGYIEGRCAEDALPEMEEDRQFALGVEAGEHLRRMHELPCPDSNYGWFERRKQKYSNRLNEAKELGLRFTRQEEIEQYVERHFDTLRDSPVRFQHDDFHPGNLIIKDGRLAGIIDFNRCDWGDPIEDFYKVPWFTIDVSVPFSRGQIAGYFDGRVPDWLWLKYNLFAAANLHGSLVWAYHHFSEGVEAWQARIRRILATLDLTGNGPPAWFAAS